MLLLLRATEKTWSVLEAAIHEINNHNASGLSFEELYRCATFRCLEHPSTQTLFSIGAAGS